MPPLATKTRTLPPPPLCESDLANLRASGLTDATIRANDIRTEDGAMVFPYRNLDGQVNCFARRRLHEPKGKAKYLQPGGTPLRAYFPAVSCHKLRVGHIAVHITEGEKKALALAQLGLATIGIGGVDCGLKDGTLIDDLAGINWNGRTVFIVFDHDAKPSTRQNVERARRKLAGVLRRAGAVVHHVCLPGPEKGVDDFIVARGGDAYKSLVKQAGDRARCTRFTAAELMAMHLPEPRCVVPGIVTEGCNLIVSRPKLGKSWFALALAIAVATGGKFLGHDIALGCVLYLALEDNQRRLQARLKKLLGEAPPPARLTFATDWPRADEGGIEEIQKWIDAADDPRLVIVDTVARFKPRRNAKQGNQYAEDYADIGDLKDVADENELALLAVHHDRKAQGTDILDDVSGTIGITGAADTILLLKRERGQHDACLHITGRDVEDAELGLKFEPATCRWSVLGLADHLRMSAERHQVFKIVEENPELTPTEITKLLPPREGTKVTINAIKKMLCLMAKDGQVKSVGGKYTVMLREQ